jgi:hypothetical protein
LIIPQKGYILPTAVVPSWRSRPMLVNLLALATGAGVRAGKGW